MNQNLSPPWHLRLWNNEEWYNEQEDVRGNVPCCCKDEMMVIRRTLGYLMVNDRSRES